MTLTPTKGYILLDSQKIKDYGYNLTLQGSVPVYTNQEEAKSRKKEGLILLLLLFMSSDGLVQSRGRWFIKGRTILHIGAGGKEAQLGGSITKNLNQRFFDAGVRHQISLMTYAQTLANTMKAALESVAPQIRALITARFFDFAGLAHTSDMPKIIQAAADIATLRGEALDTAGFLKTLPDLVKQEAGAYTTTLQKLTPYAFLSPLVVPTTAVLLKEIANTSFLGRTPSEWVSSVKTLDAQNIAQGLRVAAITAQSPQALIDAVVDPQEGAGRLIYNQIDGLTRTTVNAVAGEARQWVNEANKATLAHKEVYIAVLDNRTTEECRYLDGKIYDVGVGPYPPIHWRCRSKRGPFLSNVLDRTRSLTPELREALRSQYDEHITTDQTFEEWLPTRFKTYVGGPPEDKSYPAWLANESPKYQDYILGKKGGALFREGNLNVTKFAPYVGGNPALYSLIQAEQEFL